METYNSEKLFNDFDKKLDEYVRVKKPLFENKKSEMLDFIYGISDSAKQILCNETDKVIEGIITLQERKLVNNELNMNANLCNEFYEMAKYFYQKSFNEINESKQKVSDKELENKSEKELLIEIVKLLKAILK